MNEHTSEHTNWQINMAPLEIPKNFSYNAYMHLGNIPSSNTNSENLSMSEEADRIRTEELVDAIAMFRLHVYYPVRLKSFSKVARCDICQRDFSSCSCHPRNLTQDRRTSLEVNQLFRETTLLHMSRDLLFPTMWHFTSVDSDEPVLTPFKFRNSK